MNVHSVNPGAARRGRAPGSQRTTGPKESLRGRPRTPQLRQRILTAALATFAERGYHGAAVPLIAHAARVGAGTLYRYFPSKKALVNEVYRAAKSRLGAALFTDLDAGLAPPALFAEIWRRAARFAREEPLAFRFLEMQDHAPYLDRKSAELERSILGPIVLAAAKVGGRPALAPEIFIAFAWGALVGLFKAERLGYLKLTDTQVTRAGQACWTAFTASPQKE